MAAEKRKRGFDAGGHRVSQPNVTEYTGPVGRSEEANRQIKVEKQYKNRHTQYTSHGNWHTYGLATDNPQEGGDEEYGNWTGYQQHINNRGDVSYHYSGCEVTTSKKGEVSTHNGPSDTTKYNGCRSCSGNDGNQKELPVGGAKYQESFGYDAHYQAMYTQAYAGNATENALGKKTINAEGGVGIGVNQSSNKQVYTRWEPDGTFHLQVKPAGPEGAVAFIKITPDGTVKIITEGTTTIEAAKGMTIKTPTLTVKADVHITGEVQTDQSIVSGGVHAARAHV